MEISYVFTHSNFISFAAGAFITYLTLNYLIKSKSTLKKEERNTAGKRAEKSGVNLSSLKIIKETEEIPKDVIAAHDQLDNGLVSEIQSAFLEIADQDDIRASLEQTNITDFIKTVDSNFDVIRKYNS